MGSVSSLISGHSFHSKHCRASQYKLRKSSHLKKLNRYSDGLLRFGFSQDSGHNKSSSKGNKNEDFFYIKVSQKAHATHRTDYTSLSSGDQAGATGMDYGSHTPQKLMPFSNQLELVSNPETAPILAKVWSVPGTHPNCSYCGRLLVQTGCN